MDTYSWYEKLQKPLWAPPGWVFGPAWTALYAVIAVSFGAVFYKTATKQLPWIVALPFALNLVFNFAFTPIQFGLRNNILAAIDILLVLATLIWALIAIYLASSELAGAGGSGLRWIVWVNAPYLAWVIFATALQLTITYLNL